MASRADLETARGRPVHCADARVLGKVDVCRDETFLCHRGGVFPTTWVIRYADVESVGAEAVVLTRPAIDFIGPTLSSGQVTKRIGELVKKP